MRSAIGSGSFSLGALVAFFGLMKSVPSAMLVGGAVSLAGLVLLVSAFRSVAREIAAARNEAEIRLRESIAEKRNDGSPPRP
jgi:hypothetical protein